MINYTYCNGYVNGETNLMGDMNIENGCLEKLILKGTYSTGSVKRIDIRRHFSSVLCE